MGLPCDGTITLSIEDSPRFLYVALRSYWFVRHFHRFLQLLARAN